MGIREVSAWAGLAITLLLYVPYFVDVFRDLAAGSASPAALFGAMVSTMSVVVVVSILVHGGVALAARRQPRDERDALIESKAYKVAHLMLTGACITVVFGVSFLAMVPAAVLPEPGLRPEFLSQVLLLGVVLAESAWYLTQAVGYRRGS
jgi:hypothetical protein